MKYKTYPKMKESGMGWIGDIPEEWNAGKLKFHYDIISGKVLQSKQKIFDDILIDYITAGNVLWEKVDLDELSQMWTTKDEIERIGVKNNDLLICEGGEAGRSGILSNLKNTCIIQNHVHRVRSKNDASTKFLMYLMEFFHSSGILKTIISRVTIASLPKLTLANFPMITPTKEQNIIVKFLNIKISNIDSEISKNKKLIKLLKEKKQKTISDSITLGIDPEVPLEETGIERIGKMPKHWDLIKIKFCAYVKGRIGWEGLRSDEFTDEGPYLITGTDFDEGKINWSKCHHVELWRYEQNPYIQIKENDILITKDGTIGKVALVDQVSNKTTLNSGVMVIRPIMEKFEPSYLFWLLKSNQFIDFIEMIKSGSTIQHLYQETFENFEFTLPNSLNEQKNISEFLNKKINKIEDIEYLVSCQIKKLQENRKTILSSVITGKIDVREAIV